MNYDNAIFLKRFKELEAKEGLTLAEVASRIGWTAKDSRSKKEKPDSSRVARSLGMVKENGVYRSYVNYANATALSKALHLDPHECDL
jgi:hypothetical protein